MIKASGFYGEIITTCCQIDSNKSTALCEMFFKQLNQSSKPEHYHCLCVSINPLSEIPRFRLATSAAVFSFCVVNT